MSMEDYDVTRLPHEKLVVCVVSTTGEGEVPDNMRLFWRFLLRKDLPAGSLQATRHACFGLGDSTYPKFCFAAKRLHRRLEQLGSRTLTPLGLGDDQDGLGIDQALGPWLDSLWPSVLEMLPPPPSLAPIPDSECLPPRYSVVELDPAAAVTAPPATVFDPVGYSHCQGGTESYCARRPFPAHVLANTRLTADGPRDVRHISLDLGGSGLEYAPGDAVAVQPRNPPDKTFALIRSLGLEPQTRVEIAPAVPHAPPLPARHWTVGELFSHHLDLFGVPRRSFFATLAHFATDPQQRERLEEFASVKGASDLLEYCQRPRRTYAEVLLDFKSARRAWRRWW